MRAEPDGLLGEHLSECPFGQPARDFDGDLFRRAEIDIEPRPLDSEGTPGDNFSPIPPNRRRAAESSGLNLADAMLHLPLSLGKLRRAKLLLGILQTEMVLANRVLHLRVMTRRSKALAASKIIRYIITSCVVGGVQGLRQLLLREPQGDSNVTGHAAPLRNVPAFRTLGQESAS